MIIVAGTIRVPEDKIEALLPAAKAVIAATLEEAGCRVYAFSFDVTDRGLIRIYEEWDTRAQLDAHGKQPHMIPWRQKLVEVGASGRALKVYEADAGQSLG